MKYDLVSFDMQGTLTRHEFGEVFWLETLPELYADENDLSLEQAKIELRKTFDDWGRYDRRYYSVQYWLDRLNVEQSIGQILHSLDENPERHSAMLDIVRAIRGNCDVILLTATTRSFINFELGDRTELFDQTYSTIDDLHHAGKPPTVYKEVALSFDHDSKDCIHIGDEQLMDIDNARKANWEAFCVDDHSEETRMALRNKIREGSCEF